MQQSGGFQTHPNCSVKIKAKEEKLSFDVESRGINF